MVCLFLFKNNISQNLIQNGSFESYTNIDCNNGGFFNISVFPATRVVDYWDIYSSPDYYNIICPSGGVNVPFNYLGYSFAKHGNAYGGIIAYAGIGDETREYIYQQFSTPLISGKTYVLNFNVSLADASNGAIKNIGAYFCSALPNLTATGYISATAQIENQGGFLSDTTNWTAIQGMYTALGGEQYMILGNFRSNANTDTVAVNTNYTIALGHPRYSYYYIDDVSLIDQTTVGINELNNVNGISVYPNPTMDILNIIDNQNQFHNAKIEVKNYLGQLIYTIPYSNQIDISNLQSGIYFLYFKNTSNSKTIKFIKE
jgi:hypothetical protein